MCIKTQINKQRKLFIAIFRGFFSNAKKYIFYFFSLFLHFFLDKHGEHDYLIIEIKGGVNNLEEENHAKGGKAIV